MMRFAVKQQQMQQPEEMPTASFIAQAEAEHEAKLRDRAAAAAAAEQAERDGGEASNDGEAEVKGDLVDSEEKVGKGKTAA